MRTHDRILAASDDRELMRRWGDGDRAARTALLMRYVPLARSLAAQHRNGVEPFEDLVQVAAVGLLKAVDRWEPERGLSFSTFAVPTISGELRHYLRDHTWAVRPARSVIDLAVAIEKSREPLRAMLGHEPTAAEFAAHLGCSAALAARALESGGCRWGSSLDREVHFESESMTVGELIGADDQGFAQAEARIAFEQLTSALDPRARTILRLRFARDLRQREIADRVGLSQMHVSRIVRASVALLQRESRAAERPTAEVKGF